MAKGPLKPSPSVTATPNALFGGKGLPPNGTDVPIEDSTERWNEYVLKDGSVVRLKHSVIQFLRVDGQFDVDGNPVYAVKSAPLLLIVSTPESNRKK